MIPHKARTVLLALATWSLGLVATLVLGWLALTLLAYDAQWISFAKEFAAELTLVRIAVFAGLLVAWMDCFKRTHHLERRARLLQTGLATFICILLIEINHLRG